MSLFITLSNSILIVIYWDSIHCLIFDSLNFVIIFNKYIIVYFLRKNKSFLSLTINFFLKTPQMLNVFRSLRAANSLRLNKLELRKLSYCYCLSNQPKKQIASDLSISSPIRSYCSSAHRQQDTFKPPHQKEVGSVSPNLAIVFTCKVCSTRQVLFHFDIRLSSGIRFIEPKTSRIMMK